MKLSASFQIVDEGDLRWTWAFLQPGAVTKRKPPQAALFKNNEGREDMCE